MKSYKILTVFGIPLYISRVWLIFTAFIILMNIWTTPAFIFTFLAAYTFVTIHEYGHGIVAMRLGHECKNITIYPYAGVAMVQPFSGNPRHEFLISIAGPATNFLFSCMFFPLLWLRNDYMNILFAINVVLLIFNLLPLFPMDGGRIYKAILTSYLKNDLKAMKIAVRTNLIVAPIIAVVACYYGAYMVAIIMAIIVLVGLAGYRAARLRGNSIGTVE